MKRIVATSYESLLGDIKERIRSAQKRAVLAANGEMTALYWDIGRNIVERQRREGWGAAVIERLARDIRKAFPSMKGMSPRNIWRMRSLYIAYSHGKILPQAVAEIPWGQNVILMARIPGDNPSIGILLCATKDRVLAEYALRDIRKPIGVAEWRAKLTTSLPRDLKGSLPTIEEIEEELKLVEKTTR